MRKGRDGGKKRGKKNGKKKTGKKKKKIRMKIVATTSLPAVNRPNAHRWNAARSCQYNKFLVRIFVGSNGSRNYFWVSNFWGGSKYSRVQFCYSNLNAEFETCSQHLSALFWWGLFLFLLVKQSQPLVFKTWT